MTKTRPRYFTLVDGKRHELPDYVYVPTPRPTLPSEVTKAVREQIRACYRAGLDLETLAELFELVQPTVEAIVEKTDD